MKRCEIAECGGDRAPESKYCILHRRQARHWLAEEARLDNEEEARRQYTLDWLHGYDRPSWDEEFGWDDPEAIDDELAEAEYDDEDEEVA